MAIEDVKKTFEECATEYDRMIEKIVPYYHEQHKIILSIIPFADKDEIKVLDLGIGTGVLSKLILTNYPNSAIHGVDISEKMIEMSSKMLANYSNKATFECADIEKADYANDYDAILAGLAIHHLADENKRHFFKMMYNSMKVGGVFIIRDIVKSESKRMNALFRELWIEFEKANGADYDKIDKNSDEQDIPTTVNNHILWLKEAGFKDVDCVWKYANFAVFAAYK